MPEASNEGMRAAVIQCDAECLHPSPLPRVQPHHPACVWETGIQSKDRHPASTAFVERGFLAFIDCYMRNPTPKWTVKPNSNGAKTELNSTASVSSVSGWGWGGSVCPVTGNEAAWNFTVFTTFSIFSWLPWILIIFWFCVLALSLEVISREASFSKCTYLSNIPKFCFFSFTRILQWEDRMLQFRSEPWIIVRTRLTLKSKFNQCNKYVSNLG